ncbi:ABC transporter permease [Tabrizicola sp. J26]|uniref:ABC transporter permease n=1 Tax=Alitabrizicola rongguiensis TaxID=2909234 RepID=UPI001F45D438|nr:ABC transporter permease [Tabrizicola rongguiensis]MCF1709305.1 ABC transporter permease [Tabrizicola rongguiensis]
MTEQTADGLMLAADGKPLKQSLNRALRRQKLRAFLLIAPLLIFVLVTFIAPIGDMLFRSVENDIVADTLPRTVAALADWSPDSGAPPGEPVYRALASDLLIAVAAKTHTQLGTRLNYEDSGFSSLLRGTGRDVDDMGEDVGKALVAVDPVWDEPVTWTNLLGDPAWISAQADWAKAGDKTPEPPFVPSAAAQKNLPLTAAAYGDFARVMQTVKEDSPTEKRPWNTVAVSLTEDLKANPSAAAAFGADWQPRLSAVVAAEQGGAIPAADFMAAFTESDKAWGTPQPWEVIKTFSPRFTSGYFLNAVDLKMTPEGIAPRSEAERVYLMLFLRTMVLSLVITGTCILLGYPVAWLLANLPARTANLLMILVLLPFWTSLLVRTSAWKVLLQQQGVINDLLVWAGLVADNNRLVLINNQTGTIIAMTHILLPFMILPLYSVMKTIPPSYLRAAKSLGATDWTAFWRVYFPQSVPGIGAGSILVFILAIGYYITPELVGGAKGVFISNRIAYHIGTSLNWGLAAALGSLLLVVVLVLYWVYDRIVGIDNVKLG